jgi:hypothetical protein
VQIKSYEGKDKLMAVFSDDQGDLYAATYDGSSWTVTNTGSALETILSDANTVPFDFVIPGVTNDPPINTVPGAQAVNEDTPLAFPGTISVTDVDGNLASTQLTVTNGTVTVTLAGGASISAGTNGTNTLTVSGSEADINATLATLVYQGNLNFNGGDTLTVVSTDSAGTPLSDTDPVAITVNAINDAPVLNTAGTTALTTITEGDINNQGDLVSDIIATGAGGNPITDVDSGAVEGIAVTIVDNSNGTWEYSINGGVSYPIRRRSCFRIPRSIAFASCRRPISTAAPLSASVPGTERTATRRARPL